MFGKSDQFQELSSFMQRGAALFTAAWRSRASNLAVISKLRLVQLQQQTSAKSTYRFALSDVGLVSGITGSNIQIQHKACQVTNATQRDGKH